MYLPTRICCLIDPSSKVPRQEWNIAPISGGRGRAFTLCLSLDMCSSEHCQEVVHMQPLIICLSLSLILSPSLCLLSTSLPIRWFLVGRPASSLRGRWVPYFVWPVVAALPRPRPPPVPPSPLPSVGPGWQWLEVRYPQPMGQFTEISPPPPLTGAVRLKLSASCHMPAGDPRSLFSSLALPGPPANQPKVVSDLR